MAEADVAGVHLILSRGALSDLGRKSLELCSCSLNRVSGAGGLKQQV